MKLILLATVAGVLLTGNALADSRSIYHQDDLALTKKDVNTAALHALRDDVNRLRQELAAAAQLAQSEKQQLQQQRRLLREAIAADLAQAREQFEQFRNKKNSLLALRQQEVTDQGNQQKADQVTVKPAPMPLMTSNVLKVNPGSATTWTAPGAFRTVVAGDAEIADVINGETDHDVVVIAKKEGITNFLLLDGEGVVVANLQVHVGIPLPLGQVRIHNKKDNPAGYTSYQCAPHCVRREDKMEGNDRQPPASTIVNIGNGNPPTAK